MEEEEEKEEEYQLKQEAKVRGNHRPYTTECHFSWADYQLNHEQRTGHSENR